jgi:hypothetical protein
VDRAYVKDYYDLLGVPIENIEIANYNVIGIPTVVSAGKLKTILTKRSLKPGSPIALLHLSK